MLRDGVEQNRVGRAHREGIAGYRIDSRVGRGGMGVVYAAASGGKAYEGSKDDVESIYLSISSFF